MNAVEVTVKRAAASGAPASAAGLLSASAVSVVASTSGPPSGADTSIEGVGASIGGAAVSVCEASRMTSGVATSRSAPPSAGASVTTEPSVVASLAGVDGVHWNNSAVMIKDFRIARVYGMFFVRGKAARRCRNFPRETSVRMRGRQADPVASSGDGESKRCHGG